MEEDIYRIEIWQYHGKVDTYENKDIKDVLEWYKEEWQYVYEFGNCCFYLYKNDKELSFDEKDKLGFYDYDD